MDNPPFSILSDILKFYCKRNIKFFLFAPTLTLFSARGLDLCYLPTGVGITYENGASVNTSFITNLEKHRIHTSPELHDRLYEANKKSLKDRHVSHPRYEFPTSVVTAAGLSRLSVHGVELIIEPEQCIRIKELDAMKKAGKAIYGGGWLLSETAAKANEKAIQQKNENRARKEKERLAAITKDGNVEISEEGTYIWQLSEREHQMIADLK